MEKNKIAESEELYGELGKIFNFTQGDLEANRAGFMSYRQRNNLLKDGSLWTSLFGTLFFGLIAVAIIVNSFSANGEGLRFMLRCMMFVYCAVTLFYVFSTIIAAICVNRNLRSSRVEKVVGKVQANGYKRYELFGLSIANKEFLVHPRKHNFAWKKGVYAVYYLPNTDSILSVEAILPE